MPDSTNKLQTSLAKCMVLTWLQADRSVGCGFESWLWFTILHELWLTDTSYCVLFCPPQFTKQLPVFSMQTSPWWWQCRIKCRVPLPSPPGTLVPVFIMTIARNRKLTEVTQTNQVLKLTSYLGAKLPFLDCPAHQRILGGRMTCPHCSLKIKTLSFDMILACMPEKVQSIKRAHIYIIYMYIYL